MQCVACVQKFLQNNTIWNELIGLKLCRLMHLRLGLYLGAHEANTSQLPTVSMRRATTVLEEFKVSVRIGPITLMSTVFCYPHLNCSTCYQV